MPLARKSRDGWEVVCQDGRAGNFPDEEVRQSRLPTPIQHAVERAPPQVGIDQQRALLRVCERQRQVELTKRLPIPAPGLVTVTTIGREVPYSFTKLRRDRGTPRSPHPDSSRPSP